MSETCTRCVMLETALSELRRESADTDAELRLHKEDRLRLRANDLRLGREVERLRSLLADASPCIDRAAAGCRTTKTLREVAPGECGCVACEIDAALAEPVVAGK